MNNHEAILEARNIYKVFGSHPDLVWEHVEKNESRAEIQSQTQQLIAVRDASFSVKPGELFVIMGLSGSGKSTLIRCLNRLIEPTSGDVFIKNKNITHVDQKDLRTVRRNNIAMVFQNFALFPHMQLWENVAYGLKMQGMKLEERREKSFESLKLVGLKGWETHYPDELSGGMQQRVGLARALATDADILLMDEAFSALDPLIRTEMQDELLDLQQRLNKTIIFITHDLSEALKLGDRIAVMRDGEIVQTDKPEELLRNPANEYVATFVKNVDRSKVVTAKTIMTQSETIVSPKAGPRVALHKMEELGISSVFVVDADRRLQGIITAEKAIEGVQQNLESLDTIIQTDIPTAGPEATLKELIPVASEAKTPIAIVDENHALLGIIVRATLLSGLVEDEEEIAALVSEGGE